MIAWTVIALAFVGGLLVATLVATLSDLVHAGLIGWLDLAPHALLRVAAAQLNPAQRLTIYEEEWMPELCYIMHKADGRPLTRLVRGTSYALGLLITAHRIARRLKRTSVAASDTERLRILPLRQVPPALATAAFAGLGCYFAAQALGVTQDATIAWAALFLGVLAGGALALGYYREHHQRIWHLLAMLLGGFIITLGIFHYWFLAQIGIGPVSAAVSACVLTATVGVFVFFGYLGLRFAQPSRANTTLVDPAITTPPISSGPGR